MTAADSAWAIRQCRRLGLLPVNELRYLGHALEAAAAMADQQLILIHAIDTLGEQSRALVALREQIEALEEDRGWMLNGRDD